MGEFTDKFDLYQSKMEKLDDLSQLKISSTLKTKANKKLKKTMKPTAKKNPVKKK